LHRNCLVKGDFRGKTKEKIEVRGIQGRRRKLVLDERKDKRCYWKLERKQ
jgi:hypothetical protein